MSGKLGRNPFERKAQLRKKEMQPRILEAEQRSTPKEPAPRLNQLFDRLTVDLPADGYVLALKTFLLLR